MARVVTPPLESGGFSELDYNPENIWDSSHTLLDGTDLTFIDFNTQGTLHHLINPTASNLPTLNVADADFNGKDSFTFDGTDDIMHKAVSNWRGSDNSGMFVGVCVPINESYYLLTSDEASNLHYAHPTLYQTTLRYNLRQTAVDSYKGVDAIDDSNAHVLIIGSDASENFIFIDGVKQTLSNVSGGNNGRWMNDITVRDNITIGALRHTSSFYGNMKWAMSGYFPYTTDQDAIDLSNGLITKYIP